MDFSTMQGIVSPLACTAGQADEGGQTARMEEYGAMPERLQEQIFRSVQKILEMNKAFLDTDLTLARLSSMVGTNTTYLSRVINAAYGVNFRTLLCRYRVQFAMRLMASGMIPFPAIARKSGFSSRSVFYASFRRETGMTPYRYMRQVAEVAARNGSREDGN